MRVSLNQLKQYLDFELPSVDELVARINEQLGAVEEIIDFADKYKDAKIVRVVECEKHPDADRLSVTKIDVGGGELMQVVCGAPNVHADMWAVWLPPESIVPSTHGDKEPFVLGARELRGVMSHGMLAAGDELAINNDHDGIIEIDPEQWRPSEVEIAPGASFAEVYGLDDTIIDIENKMFTHRPDLFSQIGVAREIAGIFGHKFTSPDWYKLTAEITGGEGLELNVFSEAGANAPRFMAVAMSDVEVKPSPLWLQCALAALGSKAINNIVDATNYVMLLTAQPTHAYDYDKIRGQSLGVRMAYEGESVELLNGKTYELTPDDIVIADGEGVVGLGGIMGGANSEVSTDTKNIILEVANFDMYTVRRSSMRHGIFTDALTRFNKGQSALQNPVVMNLLMMSIKDVAGGTQASDVADLGTPASQPPVKVTKEFVNERLGLALDRDEIVSLLENVEMTTESSQEQGIEVSAPFWRTDIELPEDVVEEVGRLYGFDKLPKELPLRSAKPVPANPARKLESDLRKILSTAGASEVLTYSFVHERVLAAVGQKPEETYRITNALSPDLQYYRMSITPSLLEKVHANIKSGHDEFALFEIGKVHSKAAGLDEAGVPIEARRMAFVYASKKPKQGAAYYTAKQYLEYLAQSFGLVLQYKSIPAGSNLASANVFDVHRRARVIDVKSGQPIALTGEYTAQSSRAFKLPAYAAGFEVMIEGLSLAIAGKKDNEYYPLSKYPHVTQDLSLRAPSSVEYGQLYEIAQSAVQDATSEGSYHYQLEPISRYQAEGDAESVTTTLRLSITNYDKTLTDADVTTIFDGVVDAAQKIDAVRA